MIKFICFFLVSCASSFAIFNLSYIDNEEPKEVNLIETEHIETYENKEIDDNIQDLIVTSQIEEKELMTIEIPKINVKNKIYNKKSKLNNIDLNVIIMNESDYPDKKDGTVIIGAHSGIGKLAYFKNLNKLEIGDLVYLEYKGIKYTYRVTDSHLDKKDGSIVINYNNSKKILYLYTCNPKDKNNYLVLVCENV